MTKYLHSLRILPLYHIKKIGLAWMGLFLSSFAMEVAEDTLSSDQAFSTHFPHVVPGSAQIPPDPHVYPTIRILTHNPHIKIKGLPTEQPAAPEGPHKFKMKAPTPGGANDTTIDIPAATNPNDIPGCIDDYYRCWINTWRVAKPCLPPLKIIFTGAVTILTAILTWNDLDYTAKSAIGISGVLCGSVAGILQTCAQSADQAIKETKDGLAEIVIDYHESQKPFNSPA